MGEVLPAKRDQLLRECRGGADSGHWLHHCLDFLTKVSVGHAEYRCVGDLGMRDQQVFAFLRIDVHTAGNDHEGPSVG
jgi:hypothetical protein